MRFHSACFNISPCFANALKVLRGGRRDESFQESLPDRLSHTFDSLDDRLQTDFHFDGNRHHPPSFVQLTTRSDTILDFVSYYLCDQRWGQAIEVDTSLNTAFRLNSCGGQARSAVWRRRAGSNRCIAVLQTAPLTTWVRRRGGHYSLWERLEARGKRRDLPLTGEDWNFFSERRRLIRLRNHWFPSLVRMDCDRPILFCILFLGHQLNFINQRIH